MKKVLATILALVLALGLALVQLAKRMWLALVDKADTAQEQRKQADAAMAVANVQGVNP